MASCSSGMEVDPPASSVPSTDHLGLNPLKRSNSAPMLATTASPLPQSTCSSPIPVISTIHSQSFTASNSFPRQCERIRRYSASSMCLFSPSTPVKTPSRLAQIINEERLNVKEREAAHERETHTNLMISTSCEELSLSDPSDQEAMVTEVHKRPRSFQEPLHIFTSPYPYASSPSPTRLGKQCFSPSLCQPVRNIALSPSPSPTRKSFVRRSISPISMAPSRLAMKRKINMDSNEDTPHKRYQPSFTCISPGCSTPDRFNTHPLLHSVSSSSMSDNSPDQQVPTPTHIHRPIVHHSRAGVPSTINNQTQTTSSQLNINELHSPLVYSGSGSTQTVVSYNFHRPMVQSASQQPPAVGVGSIHQPQTNHQMAVTVGGNVQTVNFHHNNQDRSLMDHSGGNQAINNIHRHSNQQLAPSSTNIHHHPHTHHSVMPGSVFAFHPVHDSIDSMSSVSSLSHESDHSDMNDEGHLASGAGCVVSQLGGAGDFSVQTSTKPSQV